MQNLLKAWHRLMGEGNAVNIRQPRLKNSTWEATKRAYNNIITQEERDSGYLPATFQATSFTFEEKVSSTDTQCYLQHTS